MSTDFQQSFRCLYMDDEDDDDDDDDSKDIEHC